MKSDINPILENLTGFIETKIELLKLDLREDAAHVLARAMIYLILFLLAVGFFFFSNLALATYTNQLLNSQHLGYIVVASIYLILIILIWLLYKNKKVKNYIDNFVFKLFNIKTVSDMSLKNDISIKDKRDQLKAKSDDYKGALLVQVHEIRDSAENWARAIVVVGSILLVGYALTKALFEDKGKTAQKKNLPAVVGASGGSRIFNSIMEQMALFLLALAKEKLTELVKEHK